jgi:alcohol dehydrogenase
MNTNVHVQETVQEATSWDPILSGAPVGSAANMKALVFHGAGKISWEQTARPVIRATTDAIVKILKTTICGTDLHIMKGDLPEVQKGTVLGHEGVGIIVETGTAVSNFRKGDHVVISCITSCGKCDFCRKGMYSHCDKGGWILGRLIDGTQAEYVRIPYADFSLYAIPAGSDEEALVMLSDILPTGFECGVLNGQVKPGDTIAIVGAGPVGMAVLLTAQFYSPAEMIVIDLDDNRLKAAKTLGATHIINNGAENAVERIMSLTNGKGVDTAIEAVGIPATFEICQSIVAAGGHIANIGVHGKPVSLHLESLWSRNITITTRLVDTTTTPMLFKTIQSGKIEPKKLITHRFKLDQVMEAYDIFEHAGEKKALKVILEN